jgi:hypothetical protein
MNSRSILHKIRIAFEMAIKWKFKVEQAYFRQSQWVPINSGWKNSVNNLRLISLQVMFCRLEDGSFYAIDSFSSIPRSSGSQTRRTRVPNFNFFDRLEGSGFQILNFFLKSRRKILTVFATQFGNNCFCTIDSFFNTVENQLRTI